MALFDQKKKILQMSSFSYIYMGNVNNLIKNNKNCSAFVLCSLRLRTEIFWEFIYVLFQTINSQNVKI